MEVAAHVGELDQARQPVLPRQRDFAAILPQFRRHKCQSELIVAFLLGCPGDRLSFLNNPYSLSFQPCSLAIPRSAMLWALDPVK
jgi:hypothetical protein